MMMQMSGEDVCRTIKTDPLLSDIIIVVLTSKGDLQAKLDCLNLGAEEYLVKPVEMEELATRVVRLLRMAAEWKSRSALKSTDAHVEDAAKDIAAKVTDSGAMAARSKSKYGSYRVERVAGTGGMGVVYKAYDEALDRYAAVKVLSPQWASSTEFLDRFQQEAKLIAAINHPGIAHIYTFAEEEGEAYFALQWCSGGTLSDWIRKEGGIGILPAVDILLQCTQALLAAWQKGVVHRDIKPGNIMFDENQQVKIVDFGVAHREKLSEKITVAQEIIGSPAY